MVVHVDESALREEGGKSELPIESVRRISRDSSVVTVTEDDTGEPLNVGTGIHYLPVKDGLRFSRKAVMPSAVSSSMWEPLTETEWLAARA